MNSEQSGVLHYLWTGLLVTLSLSIIAEGVPQANAAAVIPNAQPCIIPAEIPGKLAIRALQRVGFSHFAAEASWGAGNLPIITYSSLYFQLSPKMQLFLSLHECGHLVLRTTNEFRANCYAIAHAGWTERDLNLIGKVHEALGALPTQYGGNGHEFWSRTEKTCPQYFARLLGD